MWTAGGGGRDSDDVAGSPLFHAAQKALDRQKRRCEAAVARCPPIVFTRVFERDGLAGVTACIGNEDIDWSEFAFDLTAHRLDIAKPGRIGCGMCGASAIALDVSPHGGERRRVPPVDRDLSALPRESPGDGGADTARTASHQGDFIPQEVHADSPYTKRCAARQRNIIRTTSGVT